MKGKLEPAFSPEARQVQRLILSTQMQQALHLLQAPTLELHSLIEEELIQNPLLEREESSRIELGSSEYTSSFSRASSPDGDDVQHIIENTLPITDSLYDQLLAQAREAFSSSQSLDLAKEILGYIDADGLLRTPLQEIALLTGASVEHLFFLLETIQTFDPPGVGARSLQEALLLQLKRRHKEDRLAFRLVQDHYEDLLHNRVPAIAKALACSPDQIRHALEEDIAPLDLRPGATLPQGHYRESIHPVIPDLMIHLHGNILKVEVQQAAFYSIRFNPAYLHLLEEPSLAEETRSYLKEKLSCGKWLLRNLHERNQTLYRIGEQLADIHKEFFSHAHGKLRPITMQILAERLELHESTIARAVSNKYLSCLHGILPLRSFFTHGYTTQTGERISSQTVKENLKSLLLQEEKTSPLSDEALSQLLHQKGIPCARRTIAKYRTELGFGNATQRRQF